MKARWGLLAVSIGLWTSACTAMVPDVYVGEGLWRKRDGSTYSAEAPLRVREVEVERTRMRVEESRDGVSLILNLETTLVVTLDDGSRHEVWVDSRSEPGRRNVVEGGFTAPNDRRYSVLANVVAYEHSARAHVTVRALGPVRSTHAVELF